MNRQNIVVTVIIAFCSLLTFEMRYFTALNGVKQGAVLSPFLCCVYVDNLVLILSKAAVGCFIGLHFVGALAYADDLVLLAPTASAMRILLAICEDYAREYLLQCT